MSAARRGEGDHFLGKDVVLGLPAVFLFPGFFVLRQTVAAATHAVNRGSNNLGSVKDPPFILNSTGLFGFTEILALGFKIHAFLAVSIDCTSSNIEANDDHLVIVSGCE